MEVQVSGAESQRFDRGQPIQEMGGVDGGGVKVELGTGGGGAEVVKRKRGRPPRAQGKQPPAKMNKEEDEDVCFICFDGGSLVLCDRRGCPKAYHPACIKRDEAFFQSKAKWNCGWHICSICQKTAHHMCYTCTYSLCKGCIKKADYVCVRGDKGFCTICMKTIMLIENSGQGKDDTAQVDFDDRTSWEYLFKVYWIYLKGKLSLALDELTTAKNPWKEASTITSVSPSTGVYNGPNGLKSITSSFGYLEGNESKRRKTDEHINIPHKETGNSVKPGTDESSSTVVLKESNNDNMLMVGKDIKRRNRRKGEERVLQNKLDEYAAIDVHNMNLIYLRRDLMVNLIEDGEKFHNKVVGSFVRIGISDSDQKHDMFRLVQVVGTSKVDVPYKVGNKSTDIMLEVLNLDRKETVSIDTISNQELSEDECRRLRQSIQCGLVKRLTVGEIQEKAVALQPVRLNDWMETEILRLNHLRERASEKGHKKGIRECVKKLQLLKTQEERERRLHEIPEVHSDLKMNPDYESDDTEEYFNKEHGEDMKPKYSGVIGKETSPPLKSTEFLDDAGSKPLKTEQPAVSLNITTYPNVGSNGCERPQNKIDCDGSTITKPNHQAAVSSSHQAAVSSSLPNIASETIATKNSPSATDNKMDDMWHYRDPNGKVQGPFSIVQLQKWSTAGYFPADMRIWSSREAESLLLNDVLKEQFHNYDVRWSQNIASSDKVGERIEGLTVCTAVSSSIIPVIPCAPKSDIHDKLSDGHDSSGRSNGQNLNANNHDLNCNPPIAVSLTKSKETTKPFNPPNMPVPAPKILNADIKQHFPLVFPVADTALVDSPCPPPEKKSHEHEIVQDAGVKEQFVPPPPPPERLVQDSMNPRSFSRSSSLELGGAQFPETLGQRGGGYTPTPVKRDDWESARAPVSSLGDRVTIPTSNVEQIIHSSPLQSSQAAYNDLSSWHGVGETIEFSTLAEESVSDLLAEVDAMESQNGLPSPTSRRNSFVEDLFYGSIEEFSPTIDQGTRSDTFSSPGDMQLPCQSTTTTDEHLARSSQGNNRNVFDFVTRDLDLNLDHMAFKQAEVERGTMSTDIRADGHASELRLPRKEMIDINDCANVEADEGERETKTSGYQVEEKVDHRKPHPVAPLDTGPDHTATKMSHGRAGGYTEEGEFVEPRVTAPKARSREVVDHRVAHGTWSEGTNHHRKVSDTITRSTSVEPEKSRTKLAGGVRADDAEDGEFIQLDPAPPLPPPPPPPQPPLLPLPSLTMRSGPPDPRRVGPSRGTTSTGRVDSHSNPSRSGSAGRDPHQRRYGGERYTSNSSSPRERGYQVEDSGYSRSSRASWSRQSSFGSGGSSGGGSGSGGVGGGGGYSRQPPSKGPRVCKFYESGRCKKGSSCKYLHP